MDPLSELTDGFEPHGTIGPWLGTRAPPSMKPWVGGVYPGWGRVGIPGGWLGGAIPVPRPGQPQDPYLTIF